VFSSTIAGHAGNGIQLSHGSGLILQPLSPLTSISGNAPFDLKCLDAESSYTGPVTAGTIDCTGF
jgi:hypothetical protein